jgi:hypothetical protein
MMDFAFFAIAFNIGKMCKSTTLKEIRAAMEALMASFTRRCTPLGLTQKAVCHLWDEIGSLTKKYIQL